MEDKKIELTEFYFSLKRIECLMEEMIFQQIISRTNNEDEANEKFQTAMKNVAASLKTDFESLPSFDEQHENIKFNVNLLSSEDNHPPQ